MHEPAAHFSQEGGNITASFCEATSPGWITTSVKFLVGGGCALVVSRQEFQAVRQCTKAIAFFAHLSKLRLA